MRTYIFTITAAVLACSAAAAAQTPEAAEVCEARSFTPWHSIAEHRPLGGISRVRKDVYLTVSKLRHELNAQPRIEP